MNLRESFRISLRSLAGNKVRAGLTMLGVVIGVMAVIALVAIGQGTTAMVTEQIQGLGSNIIMISPRARVQLTVDDAAELVKRVPTLTGAIAGVSGNVTVKWSSKSVTTTLQGTEPAYQEIRSHAVGAGRFISADDITYRRRVAVIGYTLFSDLFAETNPIGEQILINGASYTVIGVMSEKGQGMMGDADDMVILPVTTAQRLLRTNRISLITAQLQEGADSAATTAQIAAIYAAKFPAVSEAQGDSVQVISQDQILSTVSTVTATLTATLGGIAGVSLLVGGIGIMNIMLVSVAERTREIGIRKSIGARRRDILLQFLVESVILSVVGGLLGILLGVLLGRLGAAFGLPVKFSLGAMLLAFTFSAAVGLGFGVYPASRAARLDPIEALRHD